MELRSLDACLHEYAQGNDGCQLILSPHHGGTIDRSRSNRNRINSKQHRSSPVSSILFCSIDTARFSGFCQLHCGILCFSRISVACLFFFLTRHRSHLHNRIGRKILNDLHEAHLCQSCRTLQKQRHRAGRFNPGVIVTDFL
jgi:hypothetical protein